MHSIPVSGLESDIARLEVGIRQLKVQYDMFFAGALPREPLELRAELDQLIRRHAHSTINKYALRFHFNALVSRFNSFCELWGKTTRSLEEGDHRSHSSLDKFEIKERLLGRCRIGDAIDAAEGLRRLHSRYVYARRRSGAGAPDYASFLRSIDAQMQRLRHQSKCGQIELRLVLRDERVQIKARPVR